MQNLARSLSVTFLFGSLFCISAIRAADWPRFLGDAGNGVSSETNLLDQLGTDSPAVRWQVAGGIGMSAVVVADQSAITMWNDAGEQKLVALNKDTGKTLWTTALAPAYKNGQGDGPRATPTIADGRIYAFTSDGMLAAVDFATGHIVWKVDSMKLTGAKPAEYGLSSSPLVTETFVIVHVGSPQAAVAAFQKSTGELAWTAGSGPAGYSSPTLLQVAGETQVVSFVGSGVIAMTPTEGKELWSYDFETPYDCNTASPISLSTGSGDTSGVFISAGENHGCVLLNISKRDDDFTVTEQWASVDTKSVMRNEWQTSVIVGNHLYGFNNVGSAGPTTHLACINVHSGEVVWQKTRFGKGNVVLADGKLWITTMAGELVLVKADPAKFQELGRIKLFGKTRQSLSIADGRGYIRDDAEVVCLELRRPK
ncbi:PQQ-binding-like beta-propeller repeat protein [Planctomycetes bacterium K23_9]|uniref:Outer membrane biogenesis protein BamB n=1 Tax=Stieleria marina TaxID=1930275 RepID=A0A517NVU7_9BACT|nr:outer membrane biogenesis protein BamB [Planctomycetes bacterium K23_9]